MILGRSLIRPLTGALLASSVLIAPLAPGAQAQTQTNSWVTYQGLTTAVVAAERGWKSSNQFVKPKPGMEFLAVEVKIDNTTAAPRDFNAFAFKVVTADSARWSPSVGWREPSLSYGQVLAGSSVRGWLVFEVPVGNPATQLLWTPQIIGETLAIAL